MEVPSVTNDGCVYVQVCSSPVLHVSVKRGGIEGGRAEKGKGDDDKISPFLTQVRSISAHGSISNWSNPQCVHIAALSLPTENVTPTATPTMTSTDSTPVVGKLAPTLHLCGLYVPC